MHSLSFLLIKFVKGYNSSYWPTETNRFGCKSKSGTEFRTNLIKDIALFMTRMASKSYTGVGTLTFDSRGKIVVGPMRPVQIVNTYPAHLSVYSTSADCYTARIVHLLRLVRERLIGWDSRRSSGDPVWDYVCLLEARELVRACPDLNRAQPTYIRHGDDHADQYLTNEKGHIKAIIDWEL